MSQPDAPMGFDEKGAATYDDRFAKIGGVREALHLLMRALLGELPGRARVLCVGAGTGLEIQALAAHFPEWQFTAVEPSAPMLEICKRRAQEHGFAERCTFHLGYLDSLPVGEPFDAVTCLLVSHFIVDREKRQELFRQIAARLAPNGWLVNADLSGDTATREHAKLRDGWDQLMKIAGVTDEQVVAMRQAHDTHVGFLAVGELEELIASAGFDRPVQFYQSLLIRGWFSRKR
jgi:tRNA (cmo5U34)-methyltransferase